MSDIKRFSRKMRCLFQTLLFAAPIFTVSFWLNTEQALKIGINPFSIPEVGVTLNSLSLLLGFAVSMLPTLIAMKLFHLLKTLFKNYEIGNIFSKENTFYFYKLGTYMFSLAIVNFLCTGLMSLALSFQNPVGERYISLSLGTPQVLPIIIGLVIIGISYVMKEALLLEEEQQLTV